MSQKFVPGRLIFLSLILLLSSFVSMAGAAKARAKLDSIRNELQKTDDVEEKIKFYLAISRIYTKLNMDSAFIYSRIAMGLASGLKSDLPLADAYSQAADLSIRQNRLDQAFQYLVMARMYYSSGKNIKEYMWVTTLLGNIELSQDNIAGAINYYMEVTGYLEKSEKKTALLPKVLNSIGSIFMESEDYQTALGYITRALSMFREQKNVSQMVYPLMNLGEIYFALGDLNLSRDYINQSIKVASEIKDDITISRGLMMLGKILTRENQYPEAIAMLDSSMTIQERDTRHYEGPKDIQYSELLVQLGETWRCAGNLSKAFQYSHKGLAIARKMRQLNQERLAVKQLSQIHEGLSDVDSALFYHKIYLDLTEDLARMRNVRSVKLMEIKQEFKRKQRETEISMAKAESARQRMLILYVASGMGLILVILVLILMLRLEKQRKRQAENEQNRLKEKLEYQNKELMTNVMHLTRMNELVMVIAEKLDNLEMPAGSPNNDIVQSIIQELKQTRNNKSWNEFEVRFQQVHVDFYKKLSERFPDLSPNDLKMCAFMRLNLSTKEISAIIFQSQDSIRMARSRLRQKLGVAKDENLVLFLSQI